MAASQYTRRMEYLEQVPDPRRDKGRQYDWRYLLGIVAAGTAAGCRGPLAIWEWACHQRAELARVLGLVAARVPSESMRQRVLRNVDLERVEALNEAHNLELEQVSRPVTSERVVLSPDGKWIRTASAHGEAVILLGLCSQRSGMPLRQRRVPAGTRSSPWASNSTAKPTLAKGIVGLPTGSSSIAR